MPKKYIKAGVPAGDLYDVVNALTGAQEDGSQGDATLGPNGEIAIDKDGNITMNPPDGSVHTTVDNAIKLNNQPASYYAKTTDAFATYTHSFSSGVHNLTGTGDNIKFISVADYNGEPIKVNGTTCTARTIGGDNIWAGFFKRDNMITCFKKGTILNFNGGGLASSEIAKLTPQNIKTGVSITANGKTVTGNFTADGTVAANQMLSGKIAYSKGQKIVGTIPSKASQSYRPTISNQTINAGYYLSGAQTIQGDANLKSSNIRSGATIFGVRGNYTGELQAIYACGGQGNYSRKRGALYASATGALTGGPVFEWFTWSGQNIQVREVSFRANTQININVNIQNGSVNGGQASITIKKNGSVTSSSTISLNSGDTLSISGYITDSNTSGDEVGGSAIVQLTQA